MKKLVFSIALLAAVGAAEAGPWVKIAGRLKDKKDGSIKCKGGRGTCVEGELGVDVMLTPINPPTPTGVGVGYGEKRKMIVHYPGGGQSEHDIKNPQITRIGNGETLLTFEEL